MAIIFDNICEQCGTVTDTSKIHKCETKISPFKAKYTIDSKKVSKKKFQDWILMDK